MSAAEPDRGLAHGQGLGGPIRGRFQVGGDKAISQRAVLLASCAVGVSTIEGFSPAGDCRASLRLVRSLGCQVAQRGSALTISPPGRGARPAVALVDCGRSATTMRLGAGLVAGLPVERLLSGHPQLLRRPMERVARPLRRMGAEVVSAPGGGGPLLVRGGGLSGIEYRPPEASAQVKSAVLLAALRASGESTLLEPVATRDHTERLMLAMGADLTISTGPEGRSVRLRPGPLLPLDLTIPGDPSSAAFIAAAAAMVAGSEVVLEGVSLNPSRLGFFRLLSQMGALVELEEDDSSGPEPRGTIRVSQRPLRAFSVRAQDVPEVIDELPLLGLLATQADGLSSVRGAGELRLKESDRIGVLVRGLGALGARVGELQDGFEVAGGGRLRGGECDARQDHRLAMTLSLARLASAGPVRVEGAEFISDSFPDFPKFLRGTGRC